MKKIFVIVMLAASLIACGAHRTVGLAGKPTTVYVTKKDIPIGTPLAEMLSNDLVAARTIALKEVRPGALAESDFPDLISNLMIPKGSQLVMADFTRIGNTPAVFPSASAS